MITTSANVYLYHFDSLSIAKKEQGLSFFLALFFAFCYIFSMGNVFFAPTFFAKEMGKLTRQMAAYVEQYSRNVAPDVSESYINALYLPADAYDFAGMILEREYEVLSSVPEIAARIASDFPSFVGDAGNTAEALLEFWATHLGNAPEYAAQAATFGAEQLENFPIIASQVWKIVKQGPSCYAEIMGSWIDVMVGTDWGNVPANILNSAANWWAYSAAVANMFQEVVLVPIRHPAASTATSPGHDHYGNIVPNPFSGIGTFSGYNPAVFGGLGGFAPPQYSGLQLVCIAITTIDSKRESITMSDNSIVDLYTEEPTFTLYPIGNDTYSGHAGGLAGRSGAVLIPDIGLPFIAFGQGPYWRWNDIGIGFIISESWNYHISQFRNTNNKWSVIEYGSHQKSFTPYTLDPGIVENFQPPTIVNDEYSTMINKHYGKVISTYWAYIQRIDANIFFGLSEGGVWPLGVGISPGVLMGGLLGGLATLTTQTILANMLNMQSGGGRRDERRGH